MFRWIKRVLYAAANFVERDMPTVEEIQQAVARDRHLQVIPNAPKSPWGGENEQTIRSADISIIYFWTKRGEDQAETIDVKLRDRPGGCFATFVNDKLVELTLNGHTYQSEMFNTVTSRPLKEVIRKVRRISLAA